MNMPRLPVWLATLSILVMVGCASLEPQLPKSKARAAVVSAAGAEQGAPYKYGGDTRSGFDSSGLSYFAYQQAGYQIPRYAEDQLRAGNPIRFAQARPGDLLFYRLRANDSNDDTVLHVGVYMGRGEMMHASAQHDDVALETIDNDFWFQRLVGAIQILP